MEQESGHCSLWEAIQVTEERSAEKTKMVIYDDKITMLGIVHSLFM